MHYFSLKHFLSSLLLAIFLTFNLAAQSGLKKANKQYELFAYHHAIKSYLKVLEKNPNNTVALSNIADSYRHLNRMEEAAKWYNKAVIMPDVEAEHLFRYGLVLKALGKYDQAKRWFKVYAQVSPAKGEQYANSCDYAQQRMAAPAVFQVKREYANTEASDFGAAFYNNQIVFASARTDMQENILTSKGLTDWTGKALNQLYVSNIDQNGYLTQPKFLKNELNNSYNEGPLSFSANGRWVAYTKNNFVDGTRQIPSAGIELSIYLAEVDETGNWVNSKAFPFNGSGFSSGYPHLSADGSILYFASNRPDGFGGYDLFVSKKINNEWTLPENLGPTVNTQGNEITPYQDGGVLYFSSDWHLGFGGYDVFRAGKINDIWAEVFHLDKSINSPRDDYGFIYNNYSNKGYFTSNKVGGKGKEDIFNVKRRTNRIEIIVLDALFGKPIPNARIDFTACGEKSFQADANGKYSFQAARDFNCNAIVSMPDYTEQSVSVTGQKDGQITVKLNKKGDQYMGTVLELGTGLYVDEALVEVVNQNSGQRQTVKTDAGGNFYFAFEPHTSYVLNFSKAGYLQSSKIVKTFDGSNKDVIGTVVLKSSDTNIHASTSTIENASFANPSSVASPSHLSTSSIDLNVKSIDQEGFSIQVASILASQTLNIQQFDALTNYGYVYNKLGAERNRVRVGVYGTRAAAKLALRQIQIAGYIDAYIVAEGGKEIVAPPVITATMPTENNNMTSKSISNYKIRLATYKNPKWFDPSNIRQYGTIEEMQKDEWVIKLLSGFSTKEDAQFILEKVIQSGFPEAYLVTDSNGILEKITN